MEESIEPELILHRDIHGTVLMELFQVENINTDLERFLQELRDADKLGTLDAYRYVLGLVSEHEEQKMS